MKNKEKYKNELIEFIKKDGKLCKFVKKHEVFRMIGTDWESFCGETDCPACTTVLQLWLDEEYMEPPKSEVDWGKVPVDTLVRVRNRESKDWNLRYFKRFEPNWFPHFVTWVDGKTSKTVDYFAAEEWKYCELVEDEDDGSN